MRGSIKLSEVTKNISQVQREGEGVLLQLFFISLWCSLVQYGSEVMKNSDYRGLPHLIDRQP